MCTRTSITEFLSSPSLIQQLTLPVCCPAGCQPQKTRCWKGSGKTFVRLRPRSCRNRGGATKARCSSSSGVPMHGTGVRRPSATMCSGIWCACLENEIKCWKLGHCESALKCVHIFGIWDTVQSPVGNKSLPLTCCCNWLRSSCGQIM